ncbi:MAG TPA: Asp-tRNA(Asn)/Glu-tRNA(Gln) amidotransferase subunit GatC [Candidatus Paceibacterota bacterium]
MLKKEDIEHLSTLARIAISEEEKAELAAQIDTVLEYVSAISKVTTPAKDIPSAGDLHNVLRDDDNVYAGGEYTEAILTNAPRKEDLPAPRGATAWQAGGYIKVGQIM